MTTSISVDEGGAKNKDAAQSRIRRRNRMITSCLECRRRKLKCDKLQPECSNCLKFSRDCMFLAPALDSVSQKKLNELKEKMGSLEKVLEVGIARRTKAPTETGGRRGSSTDLPGEESDSDPDAAVPEDEKCLEATPLASFDAAYDEGTNADVLDTGIVIGMFRITERIGGMFRPRFSEEIALQLGAPIRKDLNDPDVPRLADHDTFISPGPTFIAPGAGFIFGDVSPRRNLLNSLPTKATADTLIQLYYHNCHFLARAVHWPSFQSQYDNFWSEVLSGIEPQASLQALVMSVLFSATVCMDESSVIQLLGSDKITAVSGFQNATETALAEAQFMKTTRLETLQALVVYLLPLCRDSLSRAHSVLIGMVIRLAECMGLHRDPAEHFGTSPIDTHVRRILWFQICFLDYHTSDKQGPRPSIRREDYDTRFPLNTNDADFITGRFADNDKAWTDMTLTRLRFECCEMMRIARVDIERLHQKKISITHALGKIESFRRAMEAKYHPILDTTISLQRYAKHVLTVSIYRIHITMLHRYHNSVEFRIPDRLRQVILTCGTSQCESGMALFTDPAFSDFRWYTPALVAWPTAILLLLEVFVFPQRREADRIWNILDFVFKPDKSLSRDLKARQILSAIRDRCAFYRDMRGFRVPVSMQHRLAKLLPIRGGKSSMDNTILPKVEGRNTEAVAALLSMNADSTEVGHESQQSTRDNSVNPTPPLEKPRDEAPTTMGSWTFDKPFSAFADNVHHPTMPRSMARQPTPSPGPPAQTDLYGAATTRNVANFPNDYLPGLDSGQSPSNSSTATENWPPPISSEHGWQYVLSSPRPQPHSNPGSFRDHQNQAPSPPGASLGSVPVTQSNYSYMPQTTLPMQMPYDSAMLQNAFPNVADIGIPGLDNEQAAGDSMMVDINWAEWDKIFPPETNTGELDQPNYHPM